ncbi:hypothetical protein KBD08_02225 [Candidatus Babeliales bacterium]|nr:hypothetical protein [Candidatus Babeliales bacterium]
MSHTIMGMHKFSKYIYTGATATLAHKVGLPVTTATLTAPTTLTARVIPTSLKDAVTEVVSNTTIASEITQTAATKIRHLSSYQEYCRLAQHTTTWPVFDPAFNALSAKTIVTATSATMNPTIYLVAPAGYAAICARRKYLERKQQKLLTGPETIYQLASEENEALQISSGGNGNNDHNDSSNSTHDHGSSSWNRLFLTKTMLGLATTTALKKLLTQDSVDQVALAKQDAEEKLEKLIDFFMNPNEENFGPGMQNYKFTSKSRNEIFSYNYNPEDKTTGKYYKNATGYIGKQFPHPNDQELLLDAKATFPSRAKTEPEKPIEEIEFRYTESFPTFLKHTPLKIKTLPQETADAIEKYVITMQQNRWTYIFDTTNPDFIENAGYGIPSEDNTCFELTAGKYGNFYCNRPSWNRYGQPFVLCAAKEIFEKWSPVYSNTMCTLVQKPLPKQELSDLDHYAYLTH